MIPEGDKYNKYIWKDTKPGSFELYSNIGCNVLAYIVEQVSGVNFRDYCMNYIFIPLSMNSTSYNYGDLDMDNIAKLYESKNFVHPPFDDRIYASGGLKTSLQDLSKFLMAYMNDGKYANYQLLKKLTIDKMLEIQNSVSGICLLWRASAGNWYGHTGGMVGTATVADIHPDSGTALIIFTNKHEGVVYRGHEIYGLVKQKANEFLP
jgi:CubicO group peptidase (beta-lactamase class C family)